MMNCPKCEKEVHPAIDITESGKPVAQCPICMNYLGTAESATDSPARAAEPEPFGVTPEGAPVRKVPTTRVVTGRVLAVEPASVDLVAAAKARLLDIDVELERLAGLQKERRRLAAMVAAAEAEDEPEPVVLVKRGFAGEAPAAE